MLGKPMRKARHRTDARIVGDDKDQSRAWSIKTHDMVSYLVNGFLQAAANWRFCPGLSPSSLMQYLYARALYGLPVWLRSPRQLASPTTMFHLIKRKCFASDGTHMCRIPGHGCWRRLIDSSRMPQSWMEGHSPGCSS